MEQIEKEGFNFNSLEAQKMSELYTKVSKEVDVYLEQKVQHQLEKMGFSFSCREEFLKFCSKRIFRLVDTSSIAYSFYFYLDYKNMQNKGTFIFGFIDDYKVNLHDKDNLIKVDRKLFTIQDFIAVKEKLDNEQIPKLKKIIVDLGKPDTVGKLRNILHFFPDDTPINFRQQPAQNLYWDSDLLFYDLPIDITNFFSSKEGK